MPARTGSSPAGADTEALNLQDPAPVLEVRFDFSPDDLELLGAPIAPEQRELMTPDSQGLTVMFVTPYRFFRGNRYGQSEILHQAYDVRPVMISAIGTIDWSQLTHADTMYSDSWKKLPSLPVLEMGWGDTKIVRFWDAFPIVEGDEQALYLEIVEAINDSDLFAWERLSAYNKANWDRDNWVCEEETDELPECLVYQEWNDGDPAKHNHGSVTNRFISRTYDGRLPTRKELAYPSDEGVVVSEWEEPACFNAKEEISQISDYLFHQVSDDGYPTWAPIDRDYPLHLPSYQGTWEALQRISRITWGYVPLLVPESDRDQLMYTEYREETNPWA